MYIAVYEVFEADLIQDNEEGSEEEEDGNDDDELDAILEQLPDDDDDDEGGDSKVCFPSAISMHMCQYNLHCVL